MMLVVGFFGLEDLDRMFGLERTMAGREAEKAGNRARRHFVTCGRQTGV